MATSGVLPSATNIALSTAPSAPIPSAIPTTPFADSELANLVQVSKDSFGGTPTTSAGASYTSTPAQAFIGNAAVPIANPLSVPPNTAFLTPSEPSGLAASLTPAIAQSPLSNAIESAKSQSVVDSPLTDFRAIWRVFSEPESPLDEVLPLRI